MAISLSDKAKRYFPSFEKDSTFTDSGIKFAALDILMNYKLKTFYKDQSLKIKTCACAFVCFCKAILKQYC
ncbi:MAG TPA: hypothetical protein DCR46_02155 [Cytophagales bacterium]|nr:hypothetical protein [Cytophagales bacterium]